MRMAKNRAGPHVVGAAAIFSLQARLQPVEPARVVVEDLAGDRGGDFAFCAALLDDVQGLDLGGLVGVAVVGADHQAVFGAVL